MDNAQYDALDTHPSRCEQPVQAVLFDRDGVLTYFDLESATAFFRPLIPLTVFELGERWHAMGTASGFPRNIAEEKTFLAKFWQQVSSDFLLTPQQVTTLEALDYTRFIVPYPEVRMVLEQLYSAGVRMGVLSNFSMASLEQSLVTAGLAEFFTVMCSASVIGAAKPAPEAYEIAVSALGVRPENCLFFDDETECIDGARRAGLRAYLVARRATLQDPQIAAIGDLHPVPLLALSR